MLHTVSLKKVREWMTNAKEMHSTCETSKDMFRFATKHNPILEDTLLLKCFVVNEEAVRWTALHEL